MRACGAEHRHALAWCNSHQAIRRGPQPASDHSGAIQHKAHAVHSVSCYLPVPFRSLRLAFRPPNGGIVARELLADAQLLLPQLLPAFLPEPASVDGEAAERRALQGRLACGERHDMSPQALDTIAKPSSMPSLLMHILVCGHHPSPTIQPRILIESPATNQLKSLLEVTLHHERTGWVRHRT